MVEHGRLEPSVLQRALAKQRDSGQRLCSLLIEARLLDPDDAARALGEQHGVAAALQRHLAHRDLELAGRLPAALARAACALPIGRMGNGAVIVVMRDPNPALIPQLARVMREPQIVLAVAPSTRLEALILDTYGAANEFDVDLNTGPIPTLDIGDGGTMPDLGALQLVVLDDQGVSKDHTQSGQFQLTGRASAITPPTQLPVVARTATPRAVHDQAASIAMGRTTTPPPSRRPRVVAPPPREKDFQLDLDELDLELGPAAATAVGTTQTRSGLQPPALDDDQVGIVDDLPVSYTHLTLPTKA